MPQLGPFELLLILIIVFVIFGVGRLPQAGAALGRSLAEFRKAVREESKEEEEEKEEVAEETKLLHAPSDEQVPTPSANAGDRPSQTEG